MPKCYRPYTRPAHLVNMFLTYMHYMQLWKGATVDCRPHSTDAWSLPVAFDELALERAVDLVNIAAKPEVRTFVSDIGYEWNLDRMPETVIAL